MGVWRKINKEIYPRSKLNNVGTWKTILRGFLIIKVSKLTFSIRNKIVEQRT